MGITITYRPAVLRKVIRNFDIYNFQGTRLARNYSFTISS
jgi:hypothetical protein